MTLNDKQIREFQKIHQRIFKKSISKQQAMNDGLALIRLVSLAQKMNREQ